MSRLRAVWASATSLLRSGEHDLEMDEEFAAHLDLATEDYIRQGLDPKAARRAALLDFGGVQQARELHRESRGLPSVESWLRDVRLAARSLRRDLGLSVFAIAIVALGIGAATLVFSVTNTLLLQPLPFEQPERLVWVANGDSDNLSAQTLQVGNLLDLLERSESFVDMAGFNAFYGPGDLHIDGERGPQRITGVPLTGNFLDLLGVEPMLGRGFSAEEVRDRAPVILLGHDLWRTRYDGDSTVVGRALRMNGEPATIIGVLPPTFDFERILTPGRSADVFVPYPLDADNDRTGNTLAVVGRLAPGFSVDVAQEELTRHAEEINGLEIERRNGVRPRLIPLHGRVSGGTRPSLLLLSGAVALLLLLVCANLSNLLLARASGRRREMAVHIALGASRGRLLRRLLLESMILSSAGAALGVGLAHLGARSLAQLEGTAIPLLHQVRLDGTVLAFSVGSATLVGLLFGIVPALQAGGTSPSAAMGDGGRTTGDLSGSLLRRSLVVCEVALACVLLIGVALFVRSLWSALEADLGFDPEHVVAIRVDPPRGRLEVEEQYGYYETLLAAVRAVPGVRNAGLSDALPLGDNFGWRVWSSRPKGADESAESLSPLVRIVDPGYQETLGLRLVAGRFVDDTDIPRADAEEGYGERAVVINEAFAKQLWPSTKSPVDAVSRRLVSGGREYQVVGVVGEARYFDLERPSGAEMYFSARQVPWTSSMDLVMRTEGAPSLHVAEIRQALRRVDPALPLETFRTMESLIEAATFDRRAVTSLLSAFAGFGWLLAALGVYSVIAYSVAQQRRELGVRMAFGATRLRVGCGVVSRNLRPILLGLGLGVAAALGLARVASSQLYGVGATDPASLGFAIAVLFSSAVLAAYLPARRAARLDLAEVLRAND